MSKSESHVRREPSESLPVVRSETGNPSALVFDNPDDSQNPLNWPISRKWVVTGVLSATGFNRIMVSTIMAPALTAISIELKMSSAEAAMSLSIYLLAVAFGPLFIGPLSEIYGRQVVLHVSNVWFLLWNFLCGFARTKGMLLSSRFLAGFGASAIYALAGGVLGDIWGREDRGRSLGAYLLFPLLGAAVGPIVGGIIVNYTTWRWVFWSTSIVQALLIIASLFAFRETYAPLILRRRARRSYKDNADQHDRADAQYQMHGIDRSIRAVLQALTRPIQFLLFHPAVQLVALLTGLEYGILYIVLSTFANLWTSKYNQSDTASGLHYIAIALGELVGSQIGGWLMDHLHKRQQSQHSQPESRLLLVIQMSILGWIGTLWYGWTAEQRLHWALVDIGVFIMMFGQQVAGMPLMAYIVDAYGEYTSSALAATQLVRSLAAFSFPLFAPSMYETLGYGWSNSIIVLIGVVFVTPATAFLWRYGGKLRESATSV